MRIIIVGPGRTGTALATGFQAAGHTLVAVVGKDRTQAATAAADFESVGLVAGDPLPAADLLVISTRDDIIAEVAALLAPEAATVDAAVHVSGVTPVSSLAPLRETGLATGSFHPLQTLPTGEAGARRLAGSWIAVTAEEPLAGTLRSLATSIGGHPFDLADDSKASYHAAAAAAANFPLVALTMAGDLFAAAGVPFAAARPLVEAVVANAFEMGPRPSLTGPVARGDLATVAAQLEAVATAAPRWLAEFTAAVRSIARLTGRSEEIDDLLAGWDPEPDRDPGEPPWRS